MWCASVNCHSQQHTWCAIFIFWITVIVCFSPVVDDPLCSALRRVRSELRLNSRGHQGRSNIYRGHNMLWDQVRTSRHASPPAGTKCSVTIEQSHINIHDVIGPLSTECLNFRRQNFSGCLLIRENRKYYTLRKLNQMQYSCRLPHYSNVPS